MPLEIDLKKELYEFFLKLPKKVLTIGITFRVPCFRARVMTFA